MLGVAKITSSFGETEGENGVSAKWGGGCVNRPALCTSSAKPTVLHSFLTATTLKKGRGKKVGSGKHAFAPSGGWMKKCTTHFGEKQ